LVKEKSLMTGTPMKNRYIFIILALLTLFLVIEVSFDIFGVFDSLFATYLLVIGFYLVYLAVVTFYVRQIEDDKTRLTAMKLTTVLLIGLTLSIGLFFWVESPDDLILILGIVWGAMAIALRDMVQNFFGSLIVIFMRIYRIGDRISVKGVYGEVMDIGLLRTTLMQMNRDAGDIPTGEIFIVPNGTLFREVIGNTSRHTSVTWDEIRVPLPSGADFDRIRESLVPVIEGHAGDYTAVAREEFDRLSQKKFLTVKDTAPVFSISLDQRGLTLSIRYITGITDRAEVRTRVSLDIARAMKELLPRTSGSE
jgi:small-conductance mechanosensitive channel